MAYIFKKNSLCENNKILELTPLLQQSVNGIPTQAFGRGVQYIVSDVVK